MSIHLRSIGRFRVLLLLIWVASARAEQTGGAPAANRLTGSPTPLFVNTDRGPARLAKVRVEGPAAKAGGTLRITIDGKTVEQRVEPAVSGSAEVAARLPADEKACRARLEFACGPLVLTATLELPASRLWKVYVAPTVHTDIGYTHHQSEIPAIHNANTDQAIALCGRYPEYRFRLECSWAARMYERDRPPEQFKKLMALARQRRIGIEANYVNMLSGLCSAEELTRLLYPSADLARRFGIPLETATQNDTPSYVWSFPTILRRAGVRYLTVGVNNNGTRGPMLRGGLDRKSPFWWEGPDGSKVLTWYAGGYVEIARAGLAKDMATTEKNLPEWIGKWEAREDYPYDAILIHGAYGDNQKIAASLAETVTAWNARYAYPKVIMTGCGEFFDHIEKHFADRLPTIRGCGGCWWEDGAASSARETAINRENHRRIVAAEAVQTVLSLLDPSRAYPREQINKAWDNVLLYDEHTWGARRWTLRPEHESVVKQWATKAAFATEGQRDANALFATGFGALAARIAGKGQGLLVYNPLSWDRSDVVAVMIPRNGQIVGPDGHRIPHQVRNAAGTETHKVVWFRAEGVPGMGYRRYDIVEGSRETLPAALPGAAPTHLESRFYRIALDGRSGGITSILDKQTGIELIDPAGPHRLGEVIYASGGKGTKAIDWALKEPAKFELSRPQRAAWQMIDQGKVLTSARSQTQVKMFPVVSLEVRLYEDIKRIDLTFQLTKTLTYEMEGVYIAFPFAAEKPEFRIEVGGAWVRPDRDMLPGACLDWFCVQNSVILDTGHGAISWSPVDTPLISLCDINTGKWLRRLDVTNGTIFAYVMNNYWPTNYKPGQDGVFNFRYSITSDKTMPTLTATRHGLGAGQPLVAMMVDDASASGVANLPRAGSFCRISSPNVVLTAFKQAEDGEACILRFMEVAGQPARFDFTCGDLPAPTAAWRCDSIERKLAPLQPDGPRIPLTIDAFGIETVRVR